jgi:NAD(P)-dependent dehydrogenase (short-subunit alcohol dehydrogenase family)
MPDTSSVVIITGAAGGIGQALVRTFHAAGFFVLAVDRAALPAGLECGEYLQIDVGRCAADDVYAEQAFARVRQALGARPLHALVNNAAVQVLGGVDALSRDEWRQTLDVNLLAPFVWTQALLPELERADGCVINMSSIHARLTKRGFVAYATSKAALSGMTRAMAVDLGGRIRVNAIEPAAIATEMLKAGFSAHPERLEGLQACHPQGRIGSPQEVASLALFLTREEARFLHGACLSLDGGISGSLLDPN